MVLKLTSQRGVSFIEIMIVVVIVALMTILSIAIFNSASVSDKAYDAQRKKDLRRIGTAFEEYFNDKECYPTQALIDNLSCNSNGFIPWLPSWPCDPGGARFNIFVENSACPKWYKLLTNLAKRNDRDIPSGWYQQSSAYLFGDGTLTATDVNYGVASPNINWYDFILDPTCLSPFKGCYIQPGPGRCSALELGQSHQNAFTDPNCTPGCQVICCFDGDVCK